MVLYLNPEEVMWEGLKMQKGLQTLLEKNDNNELTGNERERLHQMLSETHAFGEKMLEYECPKCGSPLTLTETLGPLCGWPGGCGYKP